MSKRSSEESGIAKSKAIVSAHIDTETVSVVKEYIDKIIKPLSISEDGERIIRTLLRENELKDILSAIDTSADKYLRYSDNSEPTQASALDFIDKISGILFNRRLNPIDQKISFMKNRANKRFNYFNPRVAIALLKEYVDALQYDLKYTNEQIIADLGNRLSAVLDSARNWTEWKEIVEGWIEGTKERKAERSTSTHNNQSMKEPNAIPNNQSLEELRGYVEGMTVHLEGTFILLRYILKPYPNFDLGGLKKALYEMVIEYYHKQAELSTETARSYERDDDERSDFISDFSSDEPLAHYWSYDHNEMLENVYDGKVDGDRLILLMGLDGLVATAVENFLEDLFLSSGFHSPSDKRKIGDLVAKHLNDLKGADVPLG